MGFEVFGAAKQQERWRNRNLVLDVVGFRRLLDKQPEAISRQIQDSSRLKGQGWQQI